MLSVRFIKIAGFSMLVLPAAVYAHTSSSPSIVVRTNQSLASAAVGNGQQQGHAVAAVQSKGQPAVGVGALSGQVNHFGSAGSVSVANNARLLGVDGPGGYGSPTSVSVSNPRQAPVLSKPRG